MPTSVPKPVDIRDNLHPSATTRRSDRWKPNVSAAHQRVLVTSTDSGKRVFVTRGARPHRPVQGRRAKMLWYIERRAQKTCGKACPQTARLRRIASAPIDKTARHSFRSKRLGIPLRPWRQSSTSSGMSPESHAGCYRMNWSRSTSTAVRRPLNNAIWTTVCWNCPSSSDRTARLPECWPPNPLPNGTGEMFRWPLPWPDSGRQRLRPSAWSHSER